MKKNKVLIVRFSSFGDIVQCSSVVDLIDQRLNGDIHWVTRSDFGNLVALNAKVSHVWAFNKKEGLFGLVRLAIKLRKENYTFVYDAHNNMRSKILGLFLRSRLDFPNWLTRPKDRLKRVLLFHFRINIFPRPFRGIHSYRAPLKKWGIDAGSSQDGMEEFVHWSFPLQEDAIKKSFFSMAHDSIILVPSAAWEMKRWPLEHWKQLIALMPEKKFMILGGKEDLFCEDLKKIAPDRVTNLAGKLSLIESCALVQEAQLVISADSGLLHVADALGKKGIALIGPTAFGFTSSPLIQTMEVELPCRPCSKDGSGRCSQAVYQKCMVDIAPSSVANVARRMIHE